MIIQFHNLSRLLLNWQFTKSEILLGDPNFYSRFGFESSVNYSIRSDFNVNPEVFQIKELEKGIFQGFAGIVKYHDRFNQL